jgi:site-specific DNA-methyltransferase (adenine-specific)
MPNINLWQGDCLELMKNIPDKSVDLILCDLPYGTTKNKWDSVINLEQLWERYLPIVKDNGCIALFAQTPFDKVLGVSNLKMLKYEWIFEKPIATGALNCNFAPLKAHENILIFSKSAACYVKEKDKAMIYHPQMTVGKPYTKMSGMKSSNYDMKWAKEHLIVNHGTRYPRDIQKFPRDTSCLHPTQKPVPLLEYLIKTYTNEGDVVLDNCMGSGSTGVACINTNRDFIGIELDQHYFSIAKDRIERRANQ